MDVTISDENGRDLTMRLLGYCRNGEGVTLHGWYNNQPYIVDLDIPLSVMGRYIEDVSRDDMLQPSDIPTPIMCTDEALADVYAELSRPPVKPQLKIVLGRDQNPSL